MVRNVSWPAGVKANLNPALVSLGLVWHILVVFINRCLDFFVLSLVGSFTCFAVAKDFFAPIK